MLFLENITYLEIYVKKLNSHQAFLSHVTIYVLGVSVFTYYVHEDTFDDYTKYNSVFLTLKHKKNTLKFCESAWDHGSTAGTRRPGKRSQSLNNHAVPARRDSFSPRPNQVPGFQQVQFSWRKSRDVYLAHRHSSKDLARLAVQCVVGL